MNDYVWRDGAVQDHTHHRQQNGTSGRTDFFYTAGGELRQTSTFDGKIRHQHFYNDINGQTLRRDASVVVDGHIRTDRPNQYWYRFAGQEIGRIGNDGTLETDYAASVADRQIVDDTSNNQGAFRHGTQNPVDYANFDQAFDDINSYSQGSSSGTYTVRGGESLETLALSLYGDASLWYRIAEANGLSAGVPLASGQTLTLPAGRHCQENRPLRQLLPCPSLG